MPNQQIETTRDTLIEKLNFFRTELVIASDAETKFSLTEKIKALEKQLTQSANPDSFHFDKKEPRPRYSFLSCNRESEMEILTRHFENHKSQPFQHYFIHGQRSDKPESLVERFIYEVLTVEKYEIDYPVAHENNAHPVLAPIQLRITENEQVVQSQFCGCFLHRFYHPSEHNTARISTLEDFFQSQKPILQKDYCIWVFKFDGSRRDSVLPTFIRWILEKFCCGKTPGVKFLFFYIFEEETTEKPKNFLRFWEKKSPGLLQKIKEISAQENLFCCHLPGMSRVKSKDIMNWFDRHTSQTYKAETLLEEATQKYNKHFDSETNSFSMHVVEDFLENIIKKFTAPAFQS
ncbi:MAG: hypothetical protein SF052_13220 [Bacteroidia bacterium]|nr:hypothetical protein [Bacteroidia bacterium]